MSETGLLCSTTILLATGGVLVVGYLLNRRRKRGVRMPPGPPNLPLVGSLPYLGKDIREPLRKMAEKYGDVMTVHLGMHQVVYLNTYDVIKEAFVKNGHSFSGRPQELFFLKDLCGGIGIVATEGEFWREQRRFTHTVLKDLGIGKIRLEPQIMEEVQFYLRELSRLSGAPVDPNVVTRKAICNVIYTVVNGTRRAYTDAQYERYIRDMGLAGRAIADAAPTVAWPFLRHLPGDLFKMDYLMRSRDTNHGKFYRHITAHRETLDVTNPRDFIDLYLIKMTEQDGDQSYSEDQLVQIIGDLFGAGTDTSVNTLFWAFVFTLRHPDVMRRCQAEIDDVIGGHRAPSYADRLKLPYVEATLLETARLASVVPFAVPHTTTEDVSFRGYYFPRGTEFQANLYAVHHDPVTWPEPELFTPERHLSEDGRIIRREQLIPFSIGRRVCIGESLARMVLFLFFTSVLQRFDLSVPEGHPPPPLVGELGAIHAAPELTLVFKERD